MIPLSGPTIGEEEKANVMEVLESTMLTNKEGRGKFCRLFEERVAKFTGAEHVHAMTSGTAALHACLMALGVGPGDEVILPSMTFVATVEPVLHVGAKPVFADINPETYTIDPEDVKKLFTKKTKAVMPVDLYGLPADLDEIGEIAHEHGVRVVEDAAQSIGAEYKGRRIGCTSDLACVSLYPSKNITTGEGGLVCTNDQELSEKIFRIRNHGETQPYYSEMLGYNFRMSEIHAAIGAAQIDRVRGIVDARERNARQLTSLIGDTGVETPHVPPGRKHAWHQYTVRLPISLAEKRARLMKSMEERGVTTGIIYKYPIHVMSFYSRYIHRSLPETERAVKQVLQLPVHQSLGSKDIEFVAESFNESLGGIG